MSGIRILTVDDNPYNRDILAFTLEDAGYDVIQAANGQEAVDKIHEDDTIALVLMDVEMPVMDGREATIYIKKHFLGRFIPIIFVSAEQEEQALAECLDAGGDDFLSKPFGRSILLAKIAAHSRTLSLYSELQSINQRLSFHKNLMDREHAIVEHIFKNSMSRVETQCHNLHYHISPMSMFNGDVLLVSPSPSGGLYVLLGDFTGHGLAAAIGCLPVSDVFYSMCAVQLGVSEIAQEINRKLQNLLPGNMFFCASIIELSAGGDRLTYWAGGMNDILIVNPKDHSFTVLQSQHMPLGVLSPQEFDAKSDVITTPKGHRLIVYTDGIIESQNLNGEWFGEERLHALIKSYQSGTYTDLIIHAVSEYREDGEQTDDMSLAEIIFSPIIYDRDTQSTTKEPDAKHRAIPWQLSVHLSEKDMKHNDVINQLVNLIKDKGRLASHLDVLYTVLSELFSNALEHGILQLDSCKKNDADGYVEYYKDREKALEQLKSASMDIDISVAGPERNKLLIKVTDSGSGFDIDNATQLPTAPNCQLPEEGDLSYGRGVELVTLLCESLVYSNNGRTVEAVYCLD